MAGDIVGRAGQAAADTVGGVAAGAGGLTAGVLQGLTSAALDLAGPHPTTIATPAAEPGHTTTEFRMTAVKSLLLAVFGVLAAYGVGVSGTVQAVVVAVVPPSIAALGAAYSISRGLRKRGSA